MSDQCYFPSFQVFLNSSFTSIPDRLILPRAYKAYVSLVSATIPVSWFNVQSGSLTFQYRVNGESSLRTFTFSIPGAQYSSTELATALQYSGVLAGTTTFTTIFALYQRPSNTFQVYMNYGSQILSLQMTPTPLAVLMGFTLSTIPVVKSTDFKLCWVATGNQQADLSGTRNIHLFTNLKVRQFNGSTYELNTIPVDRKFGEIIQFTSQNMFSAQMIDSHIEDLYVSFKDDLDQPINFNGLGWSIVLQFDFRNPDPHPPRIDVPHALLTTEAAEWKVNNIVGED